MSVGWSACHNFFNSAPIGALVYQHGVYYLEEGMHNREISLEGNGQCHVD